MVRADGRGKTPAAPVTGSLPAWEGRLLDLIQDDFPAVPRPFAELARRLADRQAGAGRPAADRQAGAGPGDGSGDPGEEEVHAAVVRLRRSGLIRRIGGVFDSRALGFHTTLVAAAVPAERLGEVVAAVSAYPEVTHNYAREGPFNLWFTLVAPSRDRLTEIVGELSRKTGLAFYDLPADRVFKIEVKFSFDEGPPAARAAARAAADPDAGTSGPDRAPPSAPDPADRRLIAVLQGDLPGGLRPYAEVAAQAGLSEEEVLARIEEFRNRGWLRRLAAVVAHRRAGVGGNAMVAWEVPGERLDRAGTAIAASDAVTHCYARPAVPGWPYRLYSMVHAPTRSECLRLIDEISRAVGLPSYQVLFSVREFKKTSPRYY